MSLNLLRRNPQGGSWQEKGAAVLHSRKLMGQEADSPADRIREVSAAVSLFRTYSELLSCHTTSLFQQAVGKITSFLSLKSCHHTIWKIQVWNLAEKLWHARMHQHFLDTSPGTNWARVPEKVDWSEPILSFLQSRINVTVSDVLLLWFVVVFVL